jgi:hypothetical protein
MLKPSKPNGGWGDPRDRELCLMNTYPIEKGTFLPSALLNYSSILPPFDRNKTNNIIQKSEEIDSRLQQ